MPEDKIAASKPNLAVDDDLWAEVGQDFDKGIEEASQAHAIPPQELVALLKAQGLELSRRGAGNWLSRHWLDLSLALALAAVLLLALRAWLGGGIQPGQVVVVATGDLPAYTLLASEHLTTTEKAEEILPAAFQDPGALLGALTLSAIAEGQPITAQDILSTSIAVQGQWLLAIPISGTVPLELQPGAVVQLVGAGGQTGQPTHACKALYLRIAENHLIVLLPADDASRLAEILASGGSVWPALPVQAK